MFGTKPVLGIGGHKTMQLNSPDGKRPTLSDALAMGLGKHEDAIPRCPSPAVSGTKQQFSV